jgi:uncharacterized membrane protein YwzB
MAALSFICVVMKAWQGMEFNLTLKSSGNQHLQLKMVLGTIP